jgi:thiamine-phosphate pyrophosphorylase
MDASDRILDANLNRAREALRVLEDYARLGLDDAALSRAAKDLRHALADAVRDAGLTGVVAARDIVGDVGCAISGAGEYERASLSDVATAAGKRLTEALRVIEEVGKTRSGSFGRAVERIRYAAYELDRRVAVRTHRAGRLPDAGLYVLITETLCTSDWQATAEAALRGGAAVLQLREKHLNDRELLERARWLADLCRRYDALCLVNDRPDIAALAGTDGVHVGQDDLPVSDVRRITGPGAVVGVSAHSVAEAQAASAAAPDYIAVGPMFETTTKTIGPVAGPELWSEVRNVTSLPLFPIGGIRASNAPALLERGCRWLCVCQAVVSAPDAEGAARGLSSMLDKHVARGSE